jgi:hypothetical protein
VGSGGTAGGSPCIFIHSVNPAPQMMIREQDRTIDSIAGTLSTLAQQAGLMGQEIGEHNEYVSTVRGLAVCYSNIMYQDA